jgi:uncharacterized protein YxeA
MKKNLIISIFILIVIIVSVYFVLNNSFEKMERTEISCVTKEDCLQLDCKGAGKERIYCDYNGFPECKENKCICALACI